MKIPANNLILNLLPEFIDTWINDIRKNLKSLTIAGNEKELHDFGHTLKGSALQFGLNDFAEFGSEIMTYVREGNLNAVSELEEKLIKYLLELKEKV